MNKYPFNEIKISLKSIFFDERFISKSKVFRIEVALRDTYGVVYDTFYKAIGEHNYRFLHTYESLIYPLDFSTLSAPPAVPIFESFYVRIPTKSIENLKKINLVILV